MSSLPRLTVATLCSEATAYAAKQSTIFETRLYGTNNPKTIGTFVEKEFRAYLANLYEFTEGSSAEGKDFPDLDVDMKATSRRQPQSSSPFTSARQKVYGLGYGLLVFVYEKTDDDAAKAARLDVVQAIFVENRRTGDYQLTRLLREMVERDATVDDILACFADRNLPIDLDTAGRELAEEVLASPPEQGYLTISNALQWRLNYARALTAAGQIDGIKLLRRGEK